jgi:hypothetical protein
MRRRQTLVTVHPATRTPAQLNRSGWPGRGDEFELGSGRGVRRRRLPGTAPAASCSAPATVAVQARQAAQHFQPCGLAEREADAVVLGAGMARRGSRGRGRSRSSRRRRGRRGRGACGVGVLLQSPHHGMLGRESGCRTWSIQHCKTRWYAPREALYSEPNSAITSPGPSGSTSVS